MFLLLRQEYWRTYYDSGHKYGPFWKDDRTKVRSAIVKYRRGEVEDIHI